MILTDTFIDGLIFNPPPETILERDDTLIAIGDTAALDRLG